MKIRPQLAWALTSSAVFVTTCALYAHNSAGGGADVARLILIPTLIADIAINGVHSSGGALSLIVSLAASVLVYAALLWGIFELMTFKKTSKNA